MKLTKHANRLSVRRPHTDLNKHSIFNGQVVHARCLQQGVLCRFSLSQTLFLRMGAIIGIVGAGSSFLDSTAASANEGNANSRDIIVLFVGPASNK